MTDTFTHHHFSMATAKEINSEIYETPLNGVMAIKRNYYPDDRGHFSEIAKIPTINQHLDQPFVIKQINHAHSKQNVCRGFHAESWDKLVTVIHGSCFVAIADIRPDSNSYGNVLLLQLGQAKSDFSGSLYLPAGVANSVCVTDGPIDYLYEVNKLYEERNPAGDRAISLFDQQLAIEWPLKKEEMIISNRDKEAISLQEAIL